MGDTLGGVLRRGSDRIIAGVCSGLAAYFHLDPTLVRIVFVILALAPPGVGIILYLALWFLIEPGGQPGTTSRGLGDRFRQMGAELRHEFRRGFGRAQGDPGAPVTAPPPTATPGGGDPNLQQGRWRGHPAGLWAGIVLIVLGAYLLLANLGYLSGLRWDLFWPVILIAIGLLLLLRRPR